MKLIKRKANLIIAVICAINVPVCVFVALRQNEARFAVTAAASVLLAFSNLYYALAPPKLCGLRGRARCFHRAEERLRRF